MDHLEAIVELKNVLPPVFMDKLIPLIEHKCKENLTIGYNVVDKNIRDVKGYTLDFNTPTNLFYFNIIKKEIERFFINYRGKFPKMVSNKINQIDLLKYNVSQNYKTHTDQFSNSPRHLSVILNLNDDYEGGDLIFTDQKEKEIKKIKLGKGTIIFFPSNFMYPHKIETITKGTRYSIVAWLL